MSKARQLRRLLEGPGLVRLVGAHNGLTARLVERAGFDAIWASSLEVSASHAVPDANILTMTDHLNAAIDMNDAVSIPVVVDVDQGYGNSNNVIRMVRKYEAAGIAGVAMEDKLFPKQNSLLTDGRQELASIAEFVGKIMAAKNAQTAEEFVLIARVEALIAGWGQEEALKRACAYVDAGADAILIHSKSTESTEIERFLAAWERPEPLVVVPTKYHQFTEARIAEYPVVKVVIYANHLIRSAVTAIKETLSEIHREGGVHTVSAKLIPVTELFELQGFGEMKEHESRFLRTGEAEVTAIIPAAGRHTEATLFPLVSDTPRCMLDINGKPLIQRTVESLNRVGIRRINVIAGHNAHRLNAENINRVLAENYAETGILESLLCAEEHMVGRTLILYSDILYEDDILARLMRRDEDVVLVVDSSYKNLKGKDKPLIDRVLAAKDPAEGDRAFLEHRGNHVLRIGHEVPETDANYEFIGMALFSARGIEIFKEHGRRISQGCGGGKTDFTAVIQSLIEAGVTVHCMETYKGWTEIESFEDYRRVCSVFSKREAREPRW